MLAWADRLEDGGLEVASSERDEFCRNLLDELQINVASVGARGQLRFSCPLPLGLHSGGVDRNPSAALLPESLRYNCFTCGGGSLLWFVATMLDVDTPTAKAWLKGQASLDPASTESVLRVIETMGEVEVWTPDTSPVYSEKVLESWAMIHPYMTLPRSEGGRGVPEQTLIDLKVGYAPDMRVKVGKDTFVDSQRIVIPHFWRDTLVGWQSRRLIKSDGTPKYLSTPDFPKDKTLYALPDFRTTHSLVVVESPLSVLACRHLLPEGWGITATFGASVNERQLRYLRDFERLVLFFDPDPAGEHATDVVADALEDYTQVDVVDNPWMADAADMTEAHFESLVMFAVPSVLWPSRCACTMHVKKRPANQIVYEEYDPC